MALKDVIFVSFNRRDDAFGYLAHPELNAEGLALTGHNTSGNYGVLDHLEVLKWVQKNIANFGGDPESKQKPAQLLKPPLLGFLTRLVVS